MCQGRNVVVAEDRQTVLIYHAGMRSIGMLISRLRMLQRLPGMLVPGFMSLFFMGFGGGEMSVSGAIMQLGRPLMIFMTGCIVIG